MKRTVLPRVFMSMFVLMTALCMMAQPVAQRQRKDAPRKTMKQFADEFEAKRKKCNKVITAGDLKASKSMNKADSDAKWETLIEEDFSLMTEGTDEVPGETMYPGESFDALPDELFHTPGWFGLGVYQAGGSVALNYPGFGGVLNTPLMNMEGRIRIKMRVKSIDKTRLFFVSIAAGGYDYPFDPTETGQMNMYQFAPEDGWQEIEVYVVNPYNGDDCFVQINAGTYNNGGLVVDYINVSRDLNYMGTPNTLSATNFVTDGFTANWGKSYGADSYLLTLYEKRVVGTDNVTSTNSFEEASVEDGSVTGLPDGWTATVNGTEAGEYFTSDAYDGSKALLIAGDGDTLQFDAGGSEILGTRFALKKIAGVEGSYNDIYISLFNGEYWSVWRLNVSGLSETEWTEYNLEELLEGFVPGQYTMFRINGSGFSLGDIIAVDMAECVTTPLTETTCIEEGIPVDTTSLVLTGLDLNNVYSFTVTGVSEDGRMSAASDVAYAYGVAAPIVKDATDVDQRGAYTANWESVINATSYVLNSYEMLEVAEDAEDFTVFEENFDKSDEGTPEDPVTIINVDRLQLNDYTDNYGWTGIGNMFSNGMAGCDESMYAYLDITSPAISVGSGNGEYTVTVDFVTFTEYTSLVVQGDETMYQIITAEQPGAHTATVAMTGGTSHTNLMFYTAEGYRFLLDKVTVKQDVKAGDRVYTMLGSQTLDGDATSARVSGLRPKAGYKFAYNVQAFYDRYGTVYASDLSDMQVVDFTTGISAAGVEEEADAPVEIYDLSGRKLNSTPAKGVYIIKSGNKSRKVIAR